MFTRKEYLNGSCTHQEYYGQFVSPGTKRRVITGIGKERILSSECPHFNDIPLVIWDRIVHMLPVAMSFESVGDYATQAGLVCTAKEAARQLKEEAENK